MNATEFRLKPIRTEEEHASTLRQLKEIWYAQKNTPEGDVKEILILLIDDYEYKHHSILPLSPIEAIKHQMDELGLSQQDVAPYFGGANRVSEVLNGKRNLTLKMVREISKHLHISPATLLAV